MALFFMRETNEHYLAYAFPFKPTIDGQLDGGLPASVLREVQGRQINNGASINVISPDNESMRVDELSINIIAAELEKTPNADRFGAWFGDMWIVLHPDAHSKSMYPEEVLQSMFPSNKYKTQLGTLERAIEHVDSLGFYAMNPRVTEDFAARFEKVILNIPKGAVVNWQDYMFMDAMRMFGDELRKKNCFQTFHLHTTLPEQLHQFSKGRELIEAMSKMDQVFVHTDTYAERLVRQFGLLGYQRTPKITRFDLGIDTLNIQKRLENISPSEVFNTLEFKNMDSKQQEVLTEIISTEQRDDLHRFIIADRADQGKGQSIILDAMDTYLSTLSGDEKLKNRFYFILPQLDWPIVDNNPQRQYIEFLRKKLSSLKEKYPQILHYTHGIPPKFIPVMVRNAHTITGGVQDGLCLTPQEVLKVNALLGKNRNGIIGAGTGFAMQTIRSHPNRAELVNFVRPGNIEDIVYALKRIVKLQNTTPELLGQQTSQFVKEVIDTRRDGLIYP